MSQKRKASSEVVTCPTPTPPSPPSSPVIKQKKMYLNLTKVAVSFAMSVALMLFLLWLKKSKKQKVAPVLPLEDPTPQSGGTIVDRNCPSGLATSGTYDRSRDGPYCKA